MDATLKNMPYVLFDSQIAFVFGLSIQMFDSQWGSTLVHMYCLVLVRAPLIHYRFVRVLEARRLRTQGLKIEATHSSFSVPQGSPVCLQ